MSKFRDRLPIIYKEHGIADLKMGLYLKDASVDSIWNDITQEPSEFADKYFGKRFMQELKEDAKEGYLYVMNLIKRFLALYFNVQEVLDDSKNFEINESVQNVMRVGKNIGFKHGLITQLSYSSIPQPGTSKTSDILISPELFKELFTVLPLEWSTMRKEFFMFTGGPKLYETLICRWLWITVHCIVDSVRFNFDFKIGKNQVFKSCGTQVAQVKKVEEPRGGLTSDYFTTIPQDMEAYAEYNLQKKAHVYFRVLRRSLLQKLLNHSLPTLPAWIFQLGLLPLLPPAACRFFANYTSTIAHRLKTFTTSGEFRYLAEKTLQFTHVPQILPELTNSHKIHRKIGQFMILVAERILNTDEFPVFGVEWKPVIEELTAGSSEFVCSSQMFLTIFENFNKTCCARLHNLMKDAPNAKALEFHARGSIIRFVFWFCASIVRSIFHVKLRDDFSIMELKYNDYEFEIVNEQKWIVHENVDVTMEQSEKSNEEPKLSESMEVTDEELEAARSLRAPSTLSSSTSAMVNPEYFDFYKRVEQDTKMSDEWKDMIRGMLFSNHHLVKELERVEQRYQQMCPK